MERFAKEFGMDELDKMDSFIKFLISQGYIYKCNAYKDDLTDKKIYLVVYWKEEEE